MSVAATIGAVPFFGLAVLAIASWLFGGDEGFLSADTSCAANQFSCGALLELITTLLAGAIAYVSFQYWRAYRVVRGHLERGRMQPWTLVPTATEMRHVVGRDGICEIIEDDLCQKDRRPQILVAGVGEGKTAVLVRLTGLLVERGAVPVSVRLRDATDSTDTLDFVDLAKKRFQQMVEPQILSDDEGDKVWRKFFNEGRIVILADGLEEAMRGSDARDVAIRAGVQRAADEHLPLVIASRPDEALENLDAALIHLEPLASQAAIRCIHEAHPDSELDVRQLVERAAIVEAPLFLHLARELHGERLLEGLDCKADQMSVRIQLLDRWRDRVLARGKEQLAGDRQVALDALEGIACHALAEHSHEVSLKQSEDSAYPWTVTTEPSSLRKVARVGYDIELVDRFDGGVRFRHSIMLAYLGAQRLSSILADDTADYLDRALAQPTPELLIALAIYCQRSQDDGLRGEIRERLERAALAEDGPAALELLAAAYRIDAMIKGEVSRPLTDTASRVWSQASTETPLGDVETDEAKLRAICRMATAGGDATYRVLWDVCHTQDVYRVRLAAAQALAAGGAAAHRALEEHLAAGPRLREELAVRKGRNEASRAAVRGGSLLGWILPTLLDTCRPPDEKHDKARGARIEREIDEWIAQAERGLHLGVESCLAQGFKHAANRLPHRTDPEVREFLIERAARLFDTSRWWYTRLCLLHALTLWTYEMEDSERRRKLVKVVETAARHERHPFVRRAARLCRAALGAPRSGSPALRSGLTRYIWIDETGVVSRIGSRHAVSDPSDSAGLWVPPAVGWHTLAWPARTLVAEVLLYLNLIEGGELLADEQDRSSDTRTEVSQDREQRRQKVAHRGPALPACIARSQDREERLLHAGDVDARGRRVGCSCGFKLCPYPTRSERPFRGELSESFCREQKRIVRSRWRRLKQHQYDTLLPVPVGRTRAGRLLAFWSEMESRIARIGI